MLDNGRGYSSNDNTNTSPEQSQSNKSISAGEYQVGSGPANIHQASQFLEQLGFPPAADLLEPGIGGPGGSGGGEPNITSAQAQQELASDGIKVNQSGNVTEIDGKDGSQYTFSYSQDGTVASYTTPDGKSHEVPAGSHLGVESNGSFSILDGNGTGCIYNADGSTLTTQDGNITGITDKQGQTTDFAYGANGQVDSYTTPDGTTHTVQPGESVKANENGSWSVENADHSGDVHFADGSQEVKNSQGEVTQVIAANGATTNFSYFDYEGNEQVSFTTPEGQSQTVSPSQIWLGGKGGATAAWDVFNSDGSRSDYSADGTETTKQPLNISNALSVLQSGIFNAGTGSEGAGNSTPQDPGSGKIRDLPNY